MNGGIREAVLREETLQSAPAVPKAELADWEERYGVVAGITLRGQGFSLGLWTPEPTASVVSRWRALHTSFANRFPHLTLGHQVHDRTIRWHETRSEGWHIHDSVDGHATDLDGVLMTVTVADCVPIYLLHAASGAMALLHAGWRGISAGMFERGVELLEERTTATRTEVVAHLGVAICGDCYEVGPEVVEAVTGARADGPVQFDLRAALLDRADRMGLRDVTASAWCSAHDEAFFSHRRSGGADGRMVAYLGRPMA